jgi:hypothetical protein
LVNETLRRARGSTAQGGAEWIFPQIGQRGSAPRTAGEFGGAGQRAAVIDRLQADLVEKRGLAGGRSAGFCHDDRSKLV